MYIKKIVANMNPILAYGQQMSLLRCLRLLILKVVEVVFRIFSKDQEHRKI